MAVMQLSFYLCLQDFLLVWAHSPLNFIYGHFQKAGVKYFMNKGLGCFCYFSSEENKDVCFLIRALKVQSSKNAMWLILQLCKSCIIALKDRHTDWLESLAPARKRSFYWISRRVQSRLPKFCLFLSPFFCSFFSMKTVGGFISTFYIMIIFNKCLLYTQTIRQGWLLVVFILHSSCGSML